MRVRAPASVAPIPALLFIAALAVSCTPARPPAVAVEPGFYAEVAAINNAAYPEESYVVQKGDTPRAIAAGVGADYRAFVAANGITDKTILQPGQILVVPRVRPRGPEIFTGGPAASGPDAGTAPRVISAPAPAAVASSASAAPVAAAAPVAGDRVVSAASGKVSAVHRGYLSLGDVVIIENVAEKLIYSGSFTPVVTQGQTVSEGELIGTAARGSARLTRYPK